MQFPGEPSSRRGLEAGSSWGGSEMRTLIASTLALGIGAWLSLGAAQAVADALPFTGALALQIGPWPQIVVPGAGTAIVIGSGGAGHSSALALPGASFETTALVVPVTDPLAQPVFGLQATVENGAGTLAGSGGGGFGGALPLAGSFRVCLFASCPFAVTNVVVPLSVVGQGGFFHAAGGVNLTVVGAPWTTGTVAVGSVTAMGGVSPLSNSGAPSGSVALVTPIFVSTNVAPFSIVPSFGFLDLHFVPEPGTLVLLGGGLAGLLALGRGRPRG
ncbi:MAG: hypothetical protein DCC71_19430 [Proteobacteria bacterium]|nr:MAG: hypothetical protein DCC71_19430 [Pseudomonadota bacterium]